MLDPAGRQRLYNAESRDQWAGFEGHRRRVAGLLGGGSGRLCVLGAGNANDLDLLALLAAYREVHLVDLDASALALGVDRQGVAGRPGLVTVGGLDVTGMLDAMARWSPASTIRPGELDALVDWPTNRVAPALAGPFDVVASTCLLSQLIGNAHHEPGEGHPLHDRVVRRLRLGHLRLLASLARPGGRVVLITDVASSDWVLDLEAMAESDLPALIPRLAAGLGLIRGVNPAELLALFQHDRVLASCLGGPEVVAPWRWRLHSRTYLVCAILARARLTPGRRTASRWP